MEGTFKLRVAIITRNGSNSPKVLAQGLQHMLKKLGHDSQVLEIYETLARAFPLNAKVKYSSRLHYRIRTKAKYWLQDRKIIKGLKNFDLLIFCECTPNGFWKGYYNIEYLKSLYPGVPFAYYEVYYLGNAPTQLARLEKNNDYGIDRYDWHFAVSDVTEIWSAPKPPWSRIGLDLTHTNLQPSKKDDFVVIVDFVQNHYEEFRSQQISVLDELNVNYILLEGRYSLEEIRAIYSKGSVFLLQSSEAFGLPIAECFACGCYVATPTSAWPMSWRKGKNLKEGGEGELPECFIIYNNMEGFRKEIANLKESYDLAKTPFDVYKIFYKNYPYFMEGDLGALAESLNYIIK